MHRSAYWIFWSACLAISLSANRAICQQKKIYATGWVIAKNINELVEKDRARHAKVIRSLPRATEPEWDCRTLGFVPPVVDQGSCGSCWDFSGTGMCTSALLKAGWGKNDGSFVLSEQYTLDCGKNNGCHGGDPTDVLNWCKQTGLPTTKDYGPYHANPERCRSNSSMKMHKLKDWGFCDLSQTQPAVASVQDIKNAMVAYGPIGAALAVDDDFRNIKPGEVFHGKNSEVHHAIVLVGWSDAKQAWLLRNSWGPNWCDHGYCWIAWGANEVGTEAIWCVAEAAPNPPPGQQPSHGPNYFGQQDRYNSPTLKRTSSLEYGSLPVDSRLRSN